LIVNADDYGHTPGTSAGIRLAHLQGIVTSTTVMMNRPDAEPALIKAMQECPRLGLGVHLVLTTGQPLLPSGNVPGLVDNQDNFRPLDALVGELDSLDLEQVEAEWTVQIKKFIAITGRSPDHLDSHHHVSYFTPGLFGLFTRLANRLGCPIRKPCSGEPEETAKYLPFDLRSRVFPGYLSLPSALIPRTTNHFLADFYAEKATCNHLHAIIEMIAGEPAEQTFELMCHPALPDAELERVSNYHLPRRAELEVLTDQGIMAAIQEKGIELITFGQL
jgi:predicted glycoside hydrolase/deacetylase ChbG (UPF0249 family)